jgi:xylulokinase
VTPAVLFRSVLEGLAMQSRMMLDGMTTLPGVAAPREIRLIGGVSRNSLFLAIKAAVSAQPLIVVEEPEATALGAALLGGVAAGIYPNLDTALGRLDRPVHTVEPDADLAATYARLRTTVFEHVHGAISPINRDLEAFRTGN